MVAKRIVYLPLNKFAVAYLTSVEYFERKWHSRLKKAAYSAGQIALSASNLHEAWHRLVGQNIYDLRHSTSSSQIATRHYLISCCNSSNGRYRKNTSRS